MRSRIATWAGILTSIVRALAMLDIYTITLSGGIKQPDSPFVLISLR